MYSTEGYQSKENQSLEDFAADIAVHRVDTDCNEYTPEYLLDEETPVSDEEFDRFCKLCVEAHEAEKESAQESQDYYNETQPNSYR